MSMTNCFIIMPITTPEHLVPIYSNDTDHFVHVLNHLFTPAIEKAQFNPIPPIMKGADLIQAEIIRNIETADIILCDISSLNPNVFFELGIRTALNKPVCYVKDNMTPSIPFDNSIINHYTYNSQLTPWSLKDQICQLSQHLIETRNKCNGSNTLWKYFGLSSTSKPIESKGVIEDRYEYINMKIDSMSKTIEKIANITTTANEQETRKRIEYELAGVNGELAALTDILKDKDNFSTRDQYEETLQAVNRLKEKKHKLSEDLQLQRYKNV